MQWQRLNLSHQEENKYVGIYQSTEYSMMFLAGASDKYVNRTEEQKAFAAEKG